MTARKKLATKDVSATSVSKDTLFIGFFSFDQPGEPERSGSFQMVVRAAAPEEVPEKFRRQLRKLRTTSSLFDNPVTIYFDGFVRVGGDLKTPTLMNYVSRMSAQQGEISSLLPEEGDGGVVAFGYSEEPENEEGDTEEPFLDFGGFAFRKALEKALPGHSRQAPDEGRGGAVPPSGQGRRGGGKTPRR